MTFSNEFQAFVTLHADCAGEPNYRTALPPQEHSEVMLTVTARCPGCLTERVFDLRSDEVFGLLARNLSEGNREKGGA
jgi:hypothetical protein